MIKYLSILFITFWVLNFNSNAQTIVFSNEYPEFFAQLSQRFETTADKKTAKEFLDNFYLFWNSPDVTDDDKNRIIITLNLLNKKKATPFPDYATYLSTYQNFIETKHPTASFNNWHTALNDLIAQPRFPLRHVKDFIELSNSQITQSIVSETPSVKWVSSNNNLVFEYDTVIKLIVPLTTLTCYSATDSIQIFKTQGIFYPLEKKWVGKGGLITWERAGFSSDQVFATFQKYTNQLDKPYFSIDSVTFYNKQFFSNPLVGKIDHKVTSFKNPDAASYPKFTSYEQRFKIDAIHPNMNYEGGFAQYGAKFLGAGTDENPATITIFRHDTLFITAKSLYFALRQDQIQSNDTEIRINLDSAFIYHPGLIFKYLINENEVHLIRNGDGLSKSPYFDTYHNISLDVELVKWKLSDPIIDFRMLSGASENHAFFESLSYFREEFYNQIQGMDAIHPLQGLKKCSNYYYGKKFTAADYAKFLGLPENQIRQQVMSLSFFGFVGYNVNTDEIEIRDRLNDYLLFRLGKKDFDVIRFNSTTPGKVSNAQLDLNNFDLRMNGVSTISICDHQNIVFFPKSEQILLKQNRNFLFDGTINAGMLHLYGDGFKFSYDNFRIDIKTIDSMRMQVQTGELNYFGKPQMTYVNNTIDQLSGYLQIDDPHNKSGAKYYSQYPILKSDKESYVYYEKPEIQNGGYKRDAFYFKLDTFELDSINTLTKRNFNFAGTFSSGIFPNFRQKLTVRNDYYLGFQSQTPTDGYSIYDGKAKFFAKIDLSGKGLLGNGKLTYLTSTSLSESFVFLPTQVNAQVHDFTVDSRSTGVEYPDVKGKFVKIEFQPYSDRFNASVQEDNFTLYKDETQLNGSLLITPMGLTGKGTFYMKNASLVSPAMTFSHHTTLADSSTFNLTGSGMDGVSFATSNLISTIDFEKRKGTFVSKDGGSRVDFTSNKYISIISQFSWNMDQNIISMGASGTKGNRFISVHRKQDSLHFYVPVARYIVANKTIEAEEVKYVNVGDSKVYLKDGLLNIRENAVIDPLEGVTIAIRDSVHSLFDARVIIEGKYAYNGYGKYNFVNGDNKVEVINMHKFELDKTGQTIAEGAIQSTEYFTFDSHFTYKGKVNLTASDSLLTFDGGVQMLHQCSQQGPQSYLRFMSRIDPKHVAFPVDDNTINFERQNIYKDFFIRKDSVHVYSSFLESRKDYSDIPILTGNGYLFYNTANASYDIAPFAKIANPDTTGTIIRFFDNDCNTLGEGNLNMGIELDKIKLQSAGSIYDIRDKNIINLSTLWGVDFFFNEQAWLHMIADITSSKAKNGELTAATFVKRYVEWTDTKTAQLVQVDRPLNGETKAIPAELQYLMTFANIDWTWNTATSSYIANCQGELSFVKNQIVNRIVGVKAELMKKRSGNSLDLYIQADSETWFYFAYKNGLMQTLSSNAQFNALIQTLNTDERKTKVKTGEKPFTFILAPDSKKNRFLKRIDSGLNQASDNVEEETPEKTEVEQ